MYYRVDASKRLVFGGRGVMRSREGVAGFNSLRSYAERLWPEVRSVGWQFGWNGQLAMTADHYPHVHDLGDGRLVCLGYNGRGVAVATAIGEQLAKRLIDAACSLDLPVVPVKQIPLQPFWRIGAVPAIWWNQMLDYFGC